MSEAGEQSAFVSYVEWRGFPIFHIPNGGSRNAIEAANLKRQGVRAGVPDLCIPVARKGFHGLYIEMKTRTGRVSENQKRWLELLNTEGYRAEVAKGYEAAVRIFEDYIKE